MNSVYLLFHNGGSWEDIVVVLTDVEAIELSRRHPNDRVEIFNVAKNGEYIATYNYYKNGVYTTYQ